MTPGRQGGAGPPSAPGPPRNALSAGELPRAGFLLLAAITLFWGGNWPMMKIVLAEVPVWWFRGICLIAAGTGLLAIARAGGLPVAVPRREVGPLLFCALFNIVGWHLFSAYGVSLMAAGRAAIIAFTMPLWAVLLGWPVLGERPTARRWAGLGLGLAGLAVLVGPDLRSAQAAPLGALFMLGAALCWATGTVAVKRFAWSSPTTVLVGWQLLVGAFAVLPGALFFEEAPSLASLSPRAIAAFAYVVALPMLFCHWAYFKLVRMFPVSLAAIGTLAIPVVGVFLSALILDEAVGAREIAALLLICGALALVLVAPAGKPAPGSA